MSFCGQKESLLCVWRWFRQSGVMLPADGSWGVAERIMLTQDNSAAQKTLDSFPAWTPHRDYCVIEQRRADCCMETAFLFFLLHKIYGKAKPFRQTADNILDFLYCRSGLLNRTGTRIVGIWDWSHINREHRLYFDDNAWMIFLALKIARLYPALNRKYNLKAFALKAADTLAEDAPGYLPGDRKPVPGEEVFWWGNIRLPHWGSLVCMALAEAFQAQPSDKYKHFIELYEAYLMQAADSFTASEYGYALLGCSGAAFAGVTENSLCHARFFADKLVARINPETGNIPSEHYETPSGKGLVDTIYTMNWAFLGLQNMLYFAPEYRPYYEKIAALLLKIQDCTRRKHLYGCWRGLYDLEAGQWGGGDCYEGGASSIYTGWTNAPIAWGFALDALKSSLMEI